MKVQLTMVEGDAAGFSVKLDLPEKWLGMPLSKLVKTFTSRVVKSGKACGALEVVDQKGVTMSSEVLIGGVVEGSPHLRLRPRRAGSEALTAKTAAVAASKRASSAVVKAPAQASRTPARPSANWDRDYAAARAKAESFPPQALAQAQHLLGAAEQALRGGSFDVALRTSQEALERCFPSASASRPGVRGDPRVAAAGASLGLSLYFVRNGATRG